MLEKVYSEAEIASIVQDLLPSIKNARIVTFSGPLGAGKTTLIKALSKQMGFQGRVASPTFAYLASYKVPDAIIYHFDLYRLSSVDEFREAGFDEYLYLPQSKIFIEWPEIIHTILPEDTLKITLDYVEDPKKRLIKID